MRGRSGLLYGIGAYGLWGLFPLYFGLLDPAAPLEVLAHRIAWSLLLVTALLAALGQFTGTLGRIRDGRTLRYLVPAAVLIGVNWGVYIYAVSVDRVIEAALGYFVNPLVSVAFGLLVFGERLRRTQWVALALGTVAVLVLTVAADGFPWIALVLACTFGTYGLLKKLADVGAVESLAIETLVLLVPAGIVLTLVGAAGEATFTSEGAGHAALLVAAGPVTAVPLLLFAGCVTRLPLSTVGLLQYLTPVGQFLIGWLALGEAMATSRWIGFTLVWTALVVLTLDGLRAAGAGRRETVAARLAVAEPA